MPRRGKISQEWAQPIRTKPTYHKMKYKRILLKLSGEALIGSKQYGIDPLQLQHFATEIKSIVDKRIEVAVVIGGGNIFRGLQAAESGVERVQGDYMGMLATTINAMALQSALESIGVYTRIASAIDMNEICESYIRRRVVRHLEKGRVVILSGGTGNPYFTTDSAAALRAAEIKAEVVLKGTRVNGVYSADPEKDPEATKYNNISFKEVYDKKLRVMDMTAITMCEENKLPIIVFDMNKEGNLLKIIQGENIGTLIS